MAMNLMSRLEHLTIRFNSFTMPERISLLTFPQLLSCRLTLGRTIDTDGSMIASFLTRHPTLKCVRTDCHSSQISLPNLQSFEGYADYAPILAQGITRGLKAARMIWHSGRQPQDVNTVVAALASLTNPTLPFVSSHKFVSREYSIVLGSLSRHIPHTRSLEIQLIHPWLMNEASDSIKHITECLPQFNHLAYFSLDRTMPAFRQASKVDTKQHHRAIVQTWGSVCPTLKACSFFDHAWKKLDGSWEEYPVHEFLAQSELSAFAEN
ncbi:hypothetical protein DFH08DRAFT_941931 [Mycena albidolilacea]|uniref:Uncharacterized protein n=1 Tax=Mycena albidolilacea TaxID=1033008 RepID=A0AAD7EHA6_9AGAR|nr:hypothetical protein DFH08DRAFT_941931 [Mycena albidolilacea]